MDIQTPQININEDDHSKVDESFKPSAPITVQGDFNQNCGNVKEISRRRSMWTTIIISVICDIGLGWFLFSGQEKLEQKFQMFENDSTAIHKQMIEDNNRKWEQIIRQSDSKHEEMMKQAKEGTIWILRDDIIKTIDFHEATKTITAKQYKRLKDEYEYYSSIGGNHDVKERFDDFTAKIYGTQEIKMTASLVPQKKAVQQ